MELTTMRKAQEKQAESDITQLMHAHGTSLYRFCRSLTYQKEDAEDLFQETWLLAFRKMEKIKSSKNMQSFLCQVAVYLWKSEKRKWARRNRIAPKTSLDAHLPSGEDLEQNMLNQAQSEFVQALVAKLPDKFRIPLLLHYSLEMELKEIANTLKLPVGTVKSRLFYARKKIKEDLENAEQTSR